MIMMKIIFICFLMMQMDTLKKTMELNIQFLFFTEKNKEALKYNKKLWEKTKRQVKVINDDEPIEYKKDFVKIRFESDDDLPQGKTFNVLDMITVVASVLDKNGKYYPQIFYMNARISVRMLQYEKISVSEGIDIDKLNA